MGGFGQGGGSPMGGGGMPPWLGQLMGGGPSPYAPGQRMGGGGQQGGPPSYSEWVKSLGPTMNTMDFTDLPWGGKGSSSEAGRQRQYEELYGRDDGTRGAPFDPTAGGKYGPGGPGTPWDNNPYYSQNQRGQFNPWQSPYSYGGYGNFDMQQGPYQLDRNPWDLDAGDYTPKPKDPNAPPPKWEPEYVSFDDNENF